MTESTPTRPTSVKGRIRAQIADYLQERMASGRLTGLIARAADFYGPFSETTGVPTMLILKRLKAGKSAQILGKADTVHSYTFTLDMGKALMLLGEATDSWNQVWHLPTAHPPMTGRQFVETAAKAIGVQARRATIPHYVISVMGVVNTQMREVAEMLYQYEADYVFDSSKFEERFSFSPTSYALGIEETLRHWADV
jgi:nucleoside-diphosphate-sugar epimerase